MSICGDFSLCRQSETMVDINKVADPSPSKQCMYLSTLEGSICSKSKASVTPSGSSISSPTRPKFDLNMTLVEVPSEEPPFGTVECKEFRARRSPYVVHLSNNEKERYLYHLGSIKDSEDPDLKKEIALRQKIDALLSSIDQNHSHSHGRE